MNICFSCKEILDSEKTTTDFSCKHTLCNNCLHRSVLTSSTVNHLKQLELKCICGKGNTLLYLNEIKNRLDQSFNELPKSVCKDHQSELKLYCFDCKIGICIKCINDDSHSPHDIGYPSLRCAEHYSKYIFSKDSLGQPICKKCDPIKKCLESLTFHEYSQLLNLKSNLLIKDNLPQVSNSITDLITKTVDLYENLITQIQNLRDKTIEDLKKMGEVLIDCNDINEMLDKKCKIDVNKMVGFYNYGIYYYQPINFLEIALPTIDYIKTKFDTFKKN
jgi:hypothetical protein